MKFMKSCTIRIHAMQRCIIAAIVCATVLVLCPHNSNAEQVIDCAPEPTDMPIQYGNFLSGPNCVLSSSGDTDIFRFIGSISEKVVIQMTEINASNPSLCLTLLGPDGQPTPHGGKVCSIAPARIARIDETIAKAGLHSMLVQSNSQSGFYNLTLERLAPPSPSATPLCFGCNISDRNNGFGDLDLYTFNGVVGDIITGQVNGACVTLLGPDGQPTPHGGKVCQGEHVDETIAKAGLHVFLVEVDPPVSFSSYSIDLQCLSGKCPPLLPPVCDIQMSKTSYITGDTVTAQIARLANPGTVPVPIELGLWFDVPGSPPIAFMTLGADGSFILAPGFDKNFGPLPLATVTPVLTRGAYGFNCRIVDPVTKRPLAEDMNPFTIQ